ADERGEATLSVASPLSAGGVPSARPQRRFTFAWAGIVPFVVFALAFLIIPTIYLFTNSFRNLQGSVGANPAYGQATIDNYVHLGTPNILDAYGASIEISLVTAIAGGIFGFLLAYAVIAGGLPSFLRSALMTFSGVASNFAGIPLALAFTFTLGLQGLVTRFLLTGLGIDLYSKGIGCSIYTKLGLELVYLYFQFPLMILI